MRLRFVYLLNVLFLFGCGPRERLTLEDPIVVVLQESEEHYLSALPEYLFLIDDVSFAVISEEKEVFIYNQSGKHTNTVFPKYDLSNLRDRLNIPDSVEIIDLETHPEPFIRNYPKFKILSMCATANSDLVFYYQITVPVSYNKFLFITFNSSILISDNKGNVKSRDSINLSEYHKDLSLLSFQGFYYHEDSTMFYSQAINQKEFLVYVSAFKKSDHGYTFHWNKTFPFPLELGKTRIVDRTEPNKFYALCDFKRLGNTVYFLNGKDIYNLYSGELLMEAGAGYENDSIHFVESFVVLPDENEQAAYLAYIEYVLPEIDAYDRTKRFLVIRSHSTGQIVKRIPIADNVSGLIYQNTYLAYLEEKGESMVLKKYKVTY